MEQRRLFGKEITEDPEFPEEYEQFNEIKSPLSVLWYNIRTEFEDDYPAKMHPDFARDVITWYSKKDDLVWDGCNGSGTIPLIASSLGRRSIGSDVNPKAIELARSHAIKKRLDANTKFMLGDAREIILDEKPDMIFSSFPFGLNIIGDKNHYSDEPKDISNSRNYEEFFKNTKLILENYFKNLKPGGICILDARDRTKDGKLFDLINHFRNQALECGFEIVARFMYFQMPYRTMTFKHRATGFIIPMVAAFDAMVFFKPETSSMNSFI